MGIRISYTSKEAIKVAVRPTEGEDPVDITQFPVELAFVPFDARPGVGDYKIGTWQTIKGKTYACLVVGPGASLQLAPTDEKYLPWVRIDMGAEVPEARGGADHTIEVY